MKVSEYQSKLSSRSKKFLGKTHTELSKEKIAAATSLRKKAEIEKYGIEVWLSKNFGDSNNNIGCVSKIERQLHTYMAGTYSELNLKFNKQIPGTTYICDVIINDKFIIEFIGDFWHANPLMYSESDIIKHPGGIMYVKDKWEADVSRTNKLFDLGYQVLVIWEYDWKNNRSDTLIKIQNYIYENINS